MKRGTVEPARRPERVKKVRISEDDPAGGSDNEDLEYPAASTSNRRGIIAENAYDSDSSGESDAERGAAAGNAADGDLDDMFATTAPEPASGMPPKDESDRVRDTGLQLRGDAAKGGKATLEQHDIEGQEDLEADLEDPMAVKLREGRIGAGDESDGDEEEFVEGDEHANDDDAPRSRRSKKGMGFKIDSFNMKEEMNDGRFTADGSYIANAADPLRVHDAWLAGNDSKADIRKAAAAKAKADARADAQMREADPIPDTRSGCLIELLESGLLRSGESVMGALTRLGAAKKRAAADVPKRKAAPRRPPVEDDAMDVDAAPPARDPSPPRLPTAAEERLRRATARIDRLTALASALTERDSEIYHETYDSVLREIKIEGEMPRGWEPTICDDSPVESAGAQVDAAEEEAPRPSLLKRPLVNRTAAPSAPAPSRSPLARYRYRWTASATAPADQHGKVFGPFGHAELAGWIAQGYFGGPDAPSIEVQREGTEPWGAWAAVLALS